MGRASRQKGMRGEYVLRDHLRSLGKDAVRVPLSGASEGFKGDVVIQSTGETFEMKSRKCSFGTIYSAYFMMKGPKDKLAFNLDGVCIAIGTSFEEVKAADSFFTIHEVLEGAGDLEGPKAPPDAPEAQGRRGLSGPQGQR